MCEDQGESGVSSVQAAANPDDNTPGEADLLDKPICVEADDCRADATNADTHSVEASAAQIQQAIQSIADRDAPLADNILAFNVNQLRDKNGRFRIWHTLVASIAWRPVSNRRMTTSKPSIRTTRGS